MTYHVVPLSGEKKNQMSVSLAPVERLTEPPGYWNVPPAKATVLEAVASLVRISVNDVALLEIPLGVAKVKVQFPVRVAVNTLPSSQSMVCDVPVLPITDTRSENTPDIKLVVTLNSPVPLGAISKPMLVSVPVADKDGWPPVAAFANVISLTAEPVAENLSISLVFASLIPVVIAGLVSAGLTLNTTSPEPVSSVTAVARFALEGVPNQSAMPAPKEVIPVPPLATGSVPVTWVVRSTLASVPPSVRLPEVVTVPVRVIPLTVPVPPTLVTVPPEAAVGLAL